MCEGYALVGSGLYRQRNDFHTGGGYFGYLPSRLYPAYPSDKPGHLVVELSQNAMSDEQVLFCLYPCRLEGRLLQL